MNISRQVAAALRGFSFDGNSGLLVRTVDEESVVRAAFGPRATATLSVSGKAVSAGELSATDLAALAESYRDLGLGDVPSVVHVPSIGAYVMGCSLDELEGSASGQAGAVGPGSGVTPTGRSAASMTDRNAVVQGRVAVVTGGAQGFGAEIVRALAAAGAVVVVADLNDEGARRFAEQVNADLGRTVALAVGVDVSDEASVQSMIATISARVGGIDLLVSNAGVLKAGSVKELSLDDFEFVTRVNYRGFFLCTKHASVVMATQYHAARAYGGATAPIYQTDIIQINSKSGLEGSNKNGAYAGAKFGGIGLVQSFAMELVSDGVKVNAICPGNFFEGPLWSDPDRGLFVQYLEAGKVSGAKTIDDVKHFYEQKVPMGRGCRGQDVARAILYAVEQKYETGQAIPVTGGQVMLR